MSRQRNNLMSMIYIGGLGSRASEREVEEMCRPYGKIMKIDIKNGFGFVEFAEQKDADDATHQLNGRDFYGSRLKVEFAKGPRRERRPPSHSDYRIQVDNLPYNCSWQQLKDFFRKAGEVTYADVVKDSQGRSKGLGVVEYKSYDDMKRAIRKLDDTDFLGSYIRIKEDASKEGGSGGSGGGYSRGRRYSPYGGGGRSRRRSYSRSPSPRRERRRSRSPYNGGGTSTGGGSSSGGSGGRYRGRSPTRRSRTPSPKRGRSPSRRSFSKSPKRSPVRSPVGGNNTKKESPRRSMSPPPKEDKRTPSPRGRTPTPQDK